MDFSEVDLSKLRAKWADSEFVNVGGFGTRETACKFAALVAYRCMELADSGAAEKMREEFGL